MADYSTNRKLFVPAPISPALTSRGFVQNSSNPVTSGPLKTVPFNPSNYNGSNRMRMQPVVEAIAAVNQIYDTVPEGVKQAVGEGVRKHFGSYTKSGGRRNHSSGYALSDAPNPQMISLDTGIQPNTYVSDQMEAVYQKCAPLHMTCCSVTIPTAAANKLYAYFIDVIAFHIQTAAQTNVGFNLNVNSDFTAANILKAMNALIYALQVYFYYSSILSYFSDPLNNNKGMNALRKNITPQILEDLTLLERRLLSTPCPPNLLEYLRYLSGNYYSGTAAGSPLIKISPLNPSFTGVDSGACIAALNALQDQTNNGIFTLMRRAIPQWIPKVLYDVPPAPFYDENFKTIFANLPFISFYSGAAQFNPTVASDTSPIQYNSYTSDLDGAAYALTGMAVTSVVGYQPGLMQPLGGGSSRADSSRISYYVDSGNLNNGFYGSDVDPYLVRSRPETYSLNDAGTTLYALHLPGAQNCQIVTPSTVRETAINTIKYLMMAGSISTKTEGSGFNRSSTGRRVSKKGKK